MTLSYQANFFNCVSRLLTYSVCSMALWMVSGCSDTSSGQPTEVIDRPGHIGEWWEYDKTTEERFALQRSHYDQFMGQIIADAPVDNPHAADPHQSLTTPPGSSSSSAKSPLMNWQQPETWQPSDPTAFAFAGFKTSNGVTISASQLAGRAMGLMPNINRWRGQFGLPAFNELPTDTKSINMFGVSVPIVEIYGTFTSRAGGAQPDYGMIGVFVTYGDHSYAIKATGPEAAIRAELATVMTWAESWELPRE